MNAWPEEIYGLAQREKEAWLLPQLRALSQRHAGASTDYARIVSRLFGNTALEAESYAALPYVTVSLFKLHDLVSVAEEEVFKTLSSSGTSGIASRVMLDRTTAKLQTQALTRIMKHWLGAQRRPMLIIDSQEALQDRSKLNARTTATMGFSLFGTDHTYALDGNLAPDETVLADFLQRHAGEPLLVFGFTYMVWQWLERLQGRHDLRNAFLLHGGGWKRLQEQAVPPEVFNTRLGERLGLAAVHNYYGMVEQVGSIFVACEKGYLHPPVFADVLVRDPQTLAPLPDGNKGALQLLSLIPQSYAGHSLLSEDEAIIHGHDDCPCGRRGKYFSVLGRLPKAELRGCSDTRRAV